MDTPELKNDYAGFWARLAALFMDNALIAFLTVNIYWLMRDQLLNYFAVHPEVLHIFQNESSSLGSSHTDPYLFVEKIMHFYAMGFGFIFSWMYYAGFESSHLMATPGKKVLGIYVSDYEGQRISFGKASGRYFGKIISGMILGIGYVMAGLSEKKQALHDLMAGCLVWRK
jgi:uncharacterized RDD family membrane protein YckC